MNSLDKFNIDTFINEAKQKNLMDLLEYYREELKSVDEIRFTKTSPYRNIQSQIHEYRDFIHEFSFTLRTDMKPASMKNSEFKRTKPIVESLVAKGELDRKSTRLNSSH